MATVGLLYVGAVLFLNGVMLLGRVDPKAAAVFNLFVGGLQVVTPTYLIFTAHGDQTAILSASGIYLFGFTYLYVGIGGLARLDTSGAGWFSLFVSVLAVGYSAINFTMLRDASFGVIWLYWAFLWFLFFLLLGLKREGLTAYTGWVTAIQGWVTAAIPAMLMLTGHFGYQAPQAIALALFGVVAFGGLWLLTRPRRGSVPFRAVPASPAAGSGAA